MSNWCKLISIVHKYTFRLLWPVQMCIQVYHFPKIIQLCTDFFYFACLIFLKNRIVFHEKYYDFSHQFIPLCYVLSSVNTLEQLKLTFIGYTIFETNPACLLDGLLHTMQFYPFSSKCVPCMLIRCTRLTERWDTRSLRL